MFSLITQEHRMIREAVRRQFTDLHAQDTEIRQRDERRIDGAEVGRALSDLGLFETDSDDVSMMSAQVQAAVAVESGAVALPFPVLETLTLHALRQGPCKGMASNATTTTDATTMTFTSVPSVASDSPVLQDGRLTGVAKLVPFVHLADSVVLSATRRGKLEWVTVKLDDVHLRRTPRASVESDYAIDDLHFDGATATAFAVGVEANTVDAFVQERASLLAAAEIAGACRSMVFMTRDYLLLRTQFGQPLAANQALKHAMADNHVRVEALMAAIEYAAAAIDAGDEDAEAAVITAKSFANRAGKIVADSTLQMHGAIGYTMEFPLHLLMRRVHRLTASYGSSRTQADRLFQIFQRGCVND